MVLFLQCFLVKTLRGKDARGQPYQLVVWADKCAGSSKLCAAKIDTIFAKKEHSLLRIGIVLLS